MVWDISIVIPAYNEEKNLRAAVDNVTAMIAGVVDDYEVVIVDDGSRDRTGLIADRLSRENPRITVVHNGVNKGYGHTLMSGIRRATKTYVCGFPGDNDASVSSLRDLILRGGEEDFIISYMTRQNRSALRRLISASFVGFMNVLFGLNVRYYNGLFLFRRSVVQDLPIRSEGMAVIAECVVRMIKNGCSYAQVGFEHTGRDAGTSTALRWKNVRSVLGTIAILVEDVYWKPLWARERTCPPVDAGTEKGGLRHGRIFL